jgi:hypothetical protein
MRPPDQRLLDSTVERLRAVGARVAGRSRRSHLSGRHTLASEPYALTTWVPAQPTVCITSRRGVCVCGYRCDVKVPERIQRLDDRWIPDRGRGKYLTPRPWWFLYGPIVSVLLVFAAIYASAMAAGAVAIAIRAVAVAGWIVLLGTMVRWDRSHRVARKNEL